ncbi:MAG: ribosome biogenesis/translation initiation ATPase RLI [Candidatus Woesearchaeota archaeon]
MTRLAVVKKENCKGGIDCPFLCISACPVNRTGKECITKINRDAKESKIQIDEKLCIGCGICVKRCPFEAISIINLPEELDKEPIHRYGANGFALYSLPIPIFGKVVGIVGRNGIGKSTAVRILAGVQKPNLGTNEEKGFEELLRFFKGTEAQLFFEQLRDGQIKAAYKIQNVEAIPKHYKGSVRNLLERADEKGRLEEVSNLLGLSKILDNQVDKISGGELQRVAIAAASLKNANLYIFDEPSSFLDVKERIRVAKFIRSLADEKTAVIVVEHDLIILDYMTDLIHIMYGKQGIFGTLSLPKTTRIGINIFLEGFLREENIKFRDYPIRFFAKPPADIRRQSELVSWRGIKKRIGKFSLSADSGALYLHQTVGVLGENGIGKTTLVKIFAGVENADDGTISKKIKVAYKPQYLEADQEQLVSEVLKAALEKYSAELINPLELNNLISKKLSQLSGGELQRVAIAECLSKQADLYLLDEPSAYLDVEQRMAAAKVIRDFAERTGSTVLVVDHDLMFIDYLAERLIVFSGTPTVEGFASEPLSMRDGMNAFLSGLGITLRRDIETLRPRINKEDSRRDREQKAEGKLYYE